MMYWRIGALVHGALGRPWGKEALVYWANDVLMHWWVGPLGHWCVVALGQGGIGVLEQ